MHSRIQNTASRTSAGRARLRRGGILVLALCSLGLGAHAHGSSGITEFDVPGAQGTVARGLNNNNDVVGVYKDQNNVYHGFVRTADGTITPFDPPGSTYTQAYSINDSGTAVGFYRDTNIPPNTFGFLRTADGTITNFQCLYTQPTYPFSINAKGVIVGSSLGCGPGSYDILFVYEGGQAVPTGYPGSGFSPLTASINNRGAIAGWYGYNNIDGEAGHAFFYDFQGGGYFTPFDVPGAYVDSTVASSIDDGNTIAGYYSDNTGSFTHGFLRARDGTITAFDAGAGGTFAVSNVVTTPTVLGFRSPPPSTVAGYAQDSNYNYSGFVRRPNGTITNFEAPDAGGGSSQGTFALSINRHGVLAGTYVDSNGIGHGFVGSP